MKRTIAIFLCFSMAFSICSCKSREEIKKPANFYYCTNPIIYNSESGLVSAEVRETAGCYEDMTVLLELYLQGPITDGHRSPFPSNVSVVIYYRNEGTIRLELSEEFASLSGFDLTVACTCLSMTLFELTDAQYIEISAQYSLLDSKRSITMRRDSFIFLDPSLEEGNQESE